MAPKTSLKRWRAVELCIPNEAADGVSNFLIEHGASGIEELEGNHRHVKLRTYLREDGSEKSTLQALRRYLRSLKRIAPEMTFTKVKTRSISEQDWGENWKKFFKPIRVSSQFVVKPPWSKIRLKKGEISIDIMPGMAFGTGTHATTILSIRALEESFKIGDRFILDVGTGSGILSIIAAKLGAKEVWGVDIDPAAVENARENVGKNHVSEIVRIREGSIGDFHKKFDLIIANIDLKGLKRMRRLLTNHLRDRGRLILSGILTEQEEGIRRDYLETGRLQWVKTTREREWACLTFRKK